jgi:glutaredoxin
MKIVKIYTTEVCPNCKALKEIISSQEVRYDEINMATPEALTELRMNDVFTTSAPVLQIGDVFLTVNDLFEGDEIKKESILESLK